jgi:hypothetical protein
MNKNSADYPQRPGWYPPMNTSERFKLYGKFSYVPTTGRNIKITDDWPQKNIVTVDIPQLVGVTTYGNRPFNGRVQMHRICAEPLKKLFQTWEEAGLKDRVEFWGGSWVPRFIGGTQVLSNHAFGGAFDINVATNGRGITPPLVGENGCVRELAEFAERLGWYWGGWYKGKSVDGMHFEWGFRTNTVIAAPIISGSPINFVLPDSFKKSDQTQDINVLIIYGGMGFADNKWMESQVPQEIKDRYLIAYVPYTTKLSQVLQEIDGFLLLHNLNEKKESIIGYSAGGYRVLEGYTERFSFVGLCDPSFKLTDTKKTFGNNVRMIWGGMVHTFGYYEDNHGQMQPNYLKLEDAVLRGGGYSERLKIAHIEFPKEFFLKFGKEL